MEEMGETQKENRKGPSTDPWGTPMSLFEVADCSSPILTCCNLCRRYDSIHCSAAADRPNTDRKRFDKMSWSMVTNAADKSNPISTAALLLSTIQWRLPMILSSVVSVLCRF